MSEMRESWDETKGKLKQKFAILTDSEMLFREEKEEEVLGRLQAKLGKTRKEIKNLLSHL